MRGVVRGGLIQCSLAESTELPVDKIKKAMIDKHVHFIEEAGKNDIQILCLQELFYGPYFCAEQKAKWYSMVEKIPDGPTIKLMQQYAKKYRMVMVVPIYEEEFTGVYYNTAAVIDADGAYLGKYRKHIYRKLIPASRRNSISDPEIPAILFLRHSTQRSAYIYVMTGIFPKERGFSVSAVRR